MSCQNNLRQWGLALHNHASTYNYMPPLGQYSTTVSGSVAWSMQAKLLPFVEQENLQNLIDFSMPYNQQPAVARFRVPILLCPSEVNDHERQDGPDFTHYPLNYGANAGLWLIMQPPQGMGEGVFLVNRNARLADITDGTSNTIGMSEVKAFTPYIRDSGNPSAADAPVPSSPAEIAGFGGDFKVDSGHTEWVDARIHQTGFTYTFPPNTKVPYNAGGELYDIDFNSCREGRSLTAPTFAVVTSRSYHPGGVNVLMMDGSVRLTAQSVQIDVWRAMGSRRGGEVINQQ